MSLKEADLRYWKHAKVENVLSDNAGNCPISYYIEFPLSHTDRVKGFCNGMRKQLSFCKQWKIKIRKPTRIALLTLQRMHICVVSRDTVSDLVFFFRQWSFISILMILRDSEWKETFCSAQSLRCISDVYFYCLRYPVHIDVIVLK